MDDSVRVTVTDGEESEVVRIDGTDGEVDAGGATFRFDVGDVPETEPEETASEESTESTGGDERFVAPVDDVPSGGTLRFEARAGRRRIDGILQRTDEGVLAWENSCPHEPEVQLDRGLGALIDGDQLVCHKHGARFNCDDGYCTRGPCRGRSLKPIDVAVRDGDVILTDDRFESGQRLDA
ncbi:Rieske (2Fe-2S) protein [Haloplanus sp. C73]|uniref:Rieske (2Fe-2S) protein n=1 Tax=Haloplanus sp. C73 TaxID=3421641 RepID=UPI003EBD0D9D